jgi:hypothetical protein
VRLAAAAGRRRAARPAGLDPRPARRPQDVLLVPAGPLARAAAGRAPPRPAPLA